ncbi:hypothetical protein [Halorubrum sp. DTA46]|uniref:hypothetical protein n=1 Tax=Halorubrum sp. DTA46 TaxID=3402162 RepID=UPI003AADB398
MRIRDALESDAETLAGAVDRPRAAVLDMIHERSVRVAVSEGPDDTEGDSDDRSTVAGFVAFDVHGETVHVTDFNGDESVIRRLFEEPRRFANREGMSVEVVVPNDERTGELIEAIGFERTGSGPRFDGRATTRYQVEPEESDEDES